MAACLAAVYALGFVAPIRPFAQGIVAPFRPAGHVRVFYINADSGRPLNADSGRPLNADSGRPLNADSGRLLNADSGRVTPSLQPRPRAGNEDDFKRLSAEYHDQVRQCFGDAECRRSVEDEWVQAGGLSALVALTIAPDNLPVVANAYATHQLSESKQSARAWREKTREELQANVLRAEKEERKAIGIAAEAAQEARARASVAIRLSSESWYSSREADRACRAAEAVRAAGYSGRKPSTFAADASSAPGPAPASRLARLVAAIAPWRRARARDASAAAAAPPRAPKSPNHIDGRLVAATAAARRAEATQAAEGAAQAARMAAEAEQLALELSSKAASAVAKTDARRADLAAQERVWADTVQDVKTMGAAAVGLGKAVGGALGSAAGDAVVAAFSSGLGLFGGKPSGLRVSRRRGGAAAGAAPATAAAAGEQQRER